MVRPDNSLKAKIIRIKVERGSAGLFYASSPDLKGLLVAEDTMEKLEAAVPVAIRDLYAACDVQVLVTRAEDDEEGLAPWIAFPAEIARQALQNAN